MLYLVFFFYLILHFLLYAFLLRYKRIFSSEKGIFNYHFVPSIVLLIILINLSYHSNSFTIYHVFSLMALQGIYSLTFLELWALADGGYSLAILDTLDKVEDQDQGEVIDKLILLGTKKTQARVADLVQLGLVININDGYQLTKLGRLFAVILIKIVKFAKVSFTN